MHRMHMIFQNPEIYPALCKNVPEISSFEDTGYMEMTQVCHICPILWNFLQRPKIKLDTQRIILSLLGMSGGTAHDVTC